MTNLQRNNDGCPLPEVGEGYLMPDGCRRKSGKLKSQRFGAAGNWGKPNRRDLLTLINS